MSQVFIAHHFDTIKEAKAYEKSLRESLKLEPVYIAGDLWVDRATFSRTVRISYPVMSKEYIVPPHLQSVLCQYIF